MVPLGVLVSGTVLEKQGRKNLWIFFFLLLLLGSFFSSVEKFGSFQPTLLEPCLWGHVSVLSRMSHHALGRDHEFAGQGDLRCWWAMLRGEQIGGGQTSRGQSSPPGTWPRLPLPGFCGWVRRCMWDRAFAGSLATMSWEDRLAGGSRGTPVLCHFPLCSQWVHCAPPSPAGAC